MPNNAWMHCSKMDNSEKEALLEQLQAQAQGPRGSIEIRERSLRQAALAALAAVLLITTGGWLASLPTAWHLRSAQWLFWLPGLAMMVAGLAALAGAEALRRRNGKRVLALTPETLHFANAPHPTPWYCFDAFELEQRHFSIGLVFSVTAGSRAPILAPKTFKAFASPDAWPVAAGIRVRLWLFNPVLEGQLLDFEKLTDLLYAYLEAAQARQTLSKLFPGIVQIGSQG